VHRPFPHVSLLARALAGRPYPELAGAALEAAVMVNLHGSELLLVRRQVVEGDKWSGHMGLPGGRHDPVDATLLDTALRETREEVGFDPLRHGTVLGALGTYVAAHRASGDTNIAVYVTELRERPLLELSDEVAAAYWVDLDTLVLAHGTATVREVGDPVPAYVPHVEGEPLVVWGITYGILERLRALA
jgi:8-oxo-dGTP pyrophosphatase MutT (NUDIX family)